VLKVDAENNPMNMIENMTRRAIALQQQQELNRALVRLKTTVNNIELEVASNNPDLAIKGFEELRKECIKRYGKNVIKK
jgi:ribosomal protein S20